MKHKKIAAALLGASLPLLSGCGILRAGIITVAAAVGLAGYAVYETGDAVVSGTKSVAEGTTKAVGKVVFFNGNFKAEHPHGIRFVTLGTTTALKNAGFRGVSHSGDALSAEIKAETRTGTEIRVDLKSIAIDRTSILIRVGVSGNIEESEIINGLITRELEMMYQSAVPKST